MTDLIQVVQGKMRKKIFKNTSKFYVKQHRILQIEVE